MTRTTVLFMRHEEHRDNELTQDAIERCRTIGARLRNLGYNITKWISPKHGVCIETGQEVMSGHGNAIPITRFEPKLGDASTDPELFGHMPNVETYAKEKSISVELSIKIYPPVEEIMERRRQEGARAIHRIAKKFHGQTTLVTSYGSSSMAAMLTRLFIANGLIKPSEAYDVKRFDQGDIMTLEFEESKIVSYKRIQNLALHGLP